MWSVQSWCSLSDWWAFSSSEWTFLSCGREVREPDCQQDVRVPADAPAQQQRIFVPSCLVPLCQQLEFLRAVQVPHVVPRRELKENLHHPWCDDWMISYSCSPYLSLFSVFVFWVVLESRCSSIRPLFQHSFLICFRGIAKMPIPRSYLVLIFINIPKPFGSHI